MRSGYNKILFEKHNWQYYLVIAANNQTWTQNFLFDLPDETAHAINNTTPIKVQNNLMIKNHSELFWHNLNLGLWCLRESKKYERKVEQEPLGIGKTGSAYNKSKIREVQKNSRRAAGA